MDLHQVYTYHNDTSCDIFTASCTLTWIKHRGNHTCLYTCTTLLDACLLTEKHSVWGTEVLTTINVNICALPTKFWLKDGGASMRYASCEDFHSKLRLYLACKLISEKNKKAVCGGVGLGRGNMTAFVIIYASPLPYISY